MNEEIIARLLRNLDALEARVRAVAGPDQMADAAPALQQARATLTSSLAQAPLPSDFDIKSLASLSQKLEDVHGKLVAKVQAMKVPEGQSLPPELERFQQPVTFPPIESPPVKTEGAAESALEPRGAWHGKYPWKLFGHPKSEEMQIDHRADAEVGWRSFSDWMLASSEMPLPSSSQQPAATDAPTSFVFPNPPVPQPIASKPRDHETEFTNFENWLQSEPLG